MVIFAYIPIVFYFSFEIFNNCHFFECVSIYKAYNNIYCVQIIKLITISEHLFRYMYDNVGFWESERDGPWSVCVAQTEIMFKNAFEYLTKIKQSDFAFYSSIS